MFRNKKFGSELLSGNVGVAQCVSF